MKVLVVGAGAVGQVYGYYLKKGGCEVGFLVKKKYSESLKKNPMVLQELGFFSKRKQILFHDCTIHTEFEEMKGIKWDYIIITISVSSFREGNWVDNFLSSIPPKTYLVNLSSSPDDKQIMISKGFDPNRILDSLITVMAWQAPLPHEKFSPIQSSPNENKAIGYLAQQPFPISGNYLACQPLIQAFCKGGLKAYYSTSTDKYFVLVSLVTPLFVGLEAEKWSFSRFRSSSIIPLTASAIRDSLVITSRRLNLPHISWIRFLIWSWTISLFLMISPLISPVDIEAFFCYHFTKVGDQTKIIYEELIEKGDKFHLPTSNLKVLATKNSRFSH